MKTWTVWDDEWVSDNCLTSNEQFFSCIMARTIYILWDDDDINFVLDQYAGRHVVPLGHIITIPSQPVFAVTPQCCVLSGEAANTNFIVFGLIWP